MTYNALMGAALFSAALTFSSPAANAGPDPFLGEVQIFAGTFCPRGWAEMNGQLLPIAQNSALFSLYGPTFGGDGRTTFALPDMRGRTMVGEGTGPGLSSVRLGDSSGSENTTLTVNNLASHSHRAGVQTNSNTADSTTPRRNAFAPTADNSYYTGTDPVGKFMNPNSISVDPAGSGQPVNNMQPSLTIMHCVATQGVFPSRN